VHRQRAAIKCASRGLGLGHGTRMWPGARTRHAALRAPRRVRPARTWPAARARGAAWRAAAAALLRLLLLTQHPAAAARSAGWRSDARCSAPAARPARAAARTPWRAVPRAGAGGGRPARKLLSGCHVTCAHVAPRAPPPPSPVTQTELYEHVNAHSPAGAQRHGGLDAICTHSSKALKRNSWRSRARQPPPTRTSITHGQALTCAAPPPACCAPPAATAPPPRARCASSRPRPRSSTFRRSAAAGSLALQAPAAPRLPPPPARR
jgi:hypothetical protein